MRITFVSILSVLLLSCATHKNIKSDFKSIEFKDLLVDSTLSIRSIAIHAELDRLYFSANQNTIGYIDYNSGTNLITQIPVKEGLELEFRALAIRDRIYTLSAGSPALLYSFGNDLNDSRLEFSNFSPDVFYDALSINEELAIAFGDEQDGCMSILIKNDKDWAKLSCDKLPNVESGTGAYAASNTNIKQIGKTCWAANKNQIFKSDDNGQNWQVYITPITHLGKAPGIYSIDFYNEHIGAAIGGDYTEPNRNDSNFIYTADGGETWRVINSENSPGYRSCIQFIPDSNGEGLIAVGFNGIDVSFDHGQHWTHISDEGYYTVRMATNSTGFMAGKGRISYFRLNH